MKLVGSKRAPTQGLVVPDWTPSTIWGEGATGVIMNPSAGPLFFFTLVLVLLKKESLAKI